MIWPISLDLILFSFPTVSILAETEEIKSILKNKGIDVETIAEVYPIRVQPARILSHIYSSLGKEIG